jgi:hypothetical protein
MEWEEVFEQEKLSCFNARRLALKENNFLKYFVVHLYEL